MFLKQYTQTDPSAYPVITRLCDGRNTTDRGAYPHGSRLTLRVDLPRTLGASAVVLRLQADGEADVDLPLSFVSTDLGMDRYAVTLDTKELCDENGGLFFYEFLFLRGSDTLFTDSVDNLHFDLSEQSGNRFRLLVQTNSKFHFFWTIVQF